MDEGCVGRVRLNARALSSAFEHRAHESSDEKAEITSEND